MMVCGRRLYGCVGIAVLSWTRLAVAYRPFDGTDADVAQPGEVELEIGPAGYRQEGASRFVIAPAVVANYGFAPGFEAVLEARQELQLSPGSHPWQVQDAAFSVKSMLRRGSLQGGAGLSVALEIGMLAPGFESEFGTHVGSILSLQSPAMTLHLNLGNNIFYSVRYEASTSLILEGPFSWRLRPVAELLLEREFAERSPHEGLATSGLLGTIGRYSDALSFDVAVRFARTPGGRAGEIRAGFTWDFEP
jgi:hypothetical protein